MKTSELTGALLDYWTARAEGVPAVELEIREVPRTDWKICVRVGYPMAGRDMAVPYSTSWALAGPLPEKHDLDGVLSTGGGQWVVPYMMHGSVADYMSEGSTPLIAICRAVVRAAFGDEVEDLPC